MEQYTRQPNVACVVCSKRVYRRPSGIARNKGKAYCSQQCYGLASRKEHPCPVCKKPVLAGERKNTCSRACANKTREGSKYKTNRPTKDKAAQYRTLKKHVVQTRGSKCELCGYDKYDILHVHHIDENRANNELSNLKLLCPNCHAEEHERRKQAEKSHSGLVQQF